MAKRPNVRVQATVRREASRLSTRLDNRYEKSLVVHSAVSAGRNQVQIKGNLYPAEGVAGQGGALNVVNVGTPAVARYAPPNNKSVVATSGTGRGGGGGGGSSGGGGGGAVPSPHDLSGPHHSGTLAWNLLSKSGSALSDLASRSHNELTGISANQHHNQVHALVGPDHSVSGLVPGTALVATSPTTFGFVPVKHTDLDPASILPDQHHPRAHRFIGTDHFDSGLTPGYTVRAYSATGFQWDQLQHNDLGGITQDQHHPRAHNIATGDAFGQVHTIVGAKWSLPGAVSVNTLGLITPSSAPGAAEAILRTDANGGIQLDTNLLYVDAANNRIGINQTPAAALDIKSAAVSDVTQRIKQIAGQLGRLWRIEDVAGNELIVLDSVGNLQSGNPGYVSGLRGWQITPGGNAEFNNIWARGELHATVFVKDEVHASGGTLLVATAGVINEEVIIDAATTDDDELWVKSTAVGTVPLNVKTTSSSFVGTTLHVSGIRNVVKVDNPASGPGLYFQPGEIIRVKTEIPTGITDLWLEVMSGTQDVGFSRYNIVKRSGTDAVIPKGAALVSYGKPGDGRILMTSDWRNDEGYSPYLDVFTTGAHPWDADDPTGIIPRLRLGQLKGVGVTGVSGISQYGMIASDNLANNNAGYIIASNLGIRLYKVPLTLNDGISDTAQILASGNMRLGKNVALDATTGFRFDVATGDVWIGSGVDNFLHWDQALGTLIVSGSLTVGGAGSTVDKAYVDSQDGVTLGSAKTYADGTQLAAQNYFNGLRILKVMGTWTPGAGVLSWSALTLYLSNGTTRSVAAKSGQAVSATTYLYVDLTLAGTLNMIAVTTGIVVPSPNYMLIAIAQPAASPGSTGTSQVTVNVVAGVTFISGGSIITGSIVADNIAANSINTNHIQAGAINASKIAADVYTTAGSKRVMVVDGVFTTSTSTPNLVSWTGIRLLKADSGAPVTIADGSKSVSPGQTYFYIKETDVSGCAMLNQLDTNFASIDPNAIMVATVTYASGAKSATVVMAMGGVVIAGDNIKAGTILGDRIIAGEIDTQHLHTDAVTAAKIQAGEVTAVKLSTDVFTAMGNRQAMAIQGSFNAHATIANAVTWSQLTIQKKNDVQVTVNSSAVMIGSAGFNITGRTYFYIAYTASGTVNPNIATAVASVPADSIMIAIVDPGPISGKVTITMVNGGTYVSGDGIITRSIVAGNIAVGTLTANEIDTGTITADRMNVTTLSGPGGMNGSGVINTGPLTVNGNLTMNASGNIIMSSGGKLYSAGKTTADDTSPGYFLGYESGLYKFTVGDNGEYLKWNGNNLLLKLAQPIDIRASGPNNAVLTLTDASNSHTGFLAFSFDSANNANYCISGAFYGQVYIGGPRAILNGALPSSGTYEYLRFNAPGTGVSRAFFMNASSGLITLDGAYTVTETLNAARIIATGASPAMNSGPIYGNAAGPPFNSGVPGDIAWTHEHLYVRVDTRWRRVQLVDY